MKKTKRMTLKMREIWGSRNSKSFLLRLHCPFSLRHSRQQSVHLYYKKIHYACTVADISSSVALVVADFDEVDLCTVVVVVAAAGGGGGDVQNCLLVVVPSSSDEKKNLSVYLRFGYSYSGYPFGVHFWNVSDQSPMCSDDD